MNTFCEIFYGFSRDKVFWFPVVVQMGEAVLETDGSLFYWEVLKKKKEEEEQKQTVKLLSY